MAEDKKPEENEKAAVPKVSVAKRPLAPKRERPVATEPGAVGAAASATGSLSGEQASELRNKVSRLELAMDITRRFSSTLDIDKLMETILKDVTAVLEAEACSFWMHDTEASEVICKVATGPSSDKILGLRLKVGQGIVGWVVEHEEKVVIFDAQKDERFNKDADKKSGFVTKSMLCVPLMVNSECVGALQLLNKKSTSGQFGQHDLEMLELLAANGAISIKNALLHRSEQQIKELNALLEVSKEVSSTLDLDRVLLSIVNLGAKVIFYKRALVGLLDFDENIELKAESKRPHVDMDDKQNKLLLKIMDYVKGKGENLLIIDYRKDAPPKGVPDFVLQYLNDYGLFCFSAYILKDTEGVLGVLTMEGEYNRLIRPESEYVIEIILGQATMSVRNASLYTNIPSSSLGVITDAVARGSKDKKKRRMMIAGGVLAFIIFCFFVPLPHNIVSNVEVTPLRVALVTARTDGVIRQLFFKEGQLIKAGDVLFELDDAALLLEKEKLNHDRQIAIGDLRRFDNEGKSLEAQLQRIKVEQADKQLELIEYKLSMTKIVATASGRILSKKPQELINKQVALGEEVSQIAIDDQKSAVLKIPEADVIYIAPQASVTLSLQTFPDHPFSGKVDLISIQKEEATGQAQTDPSLRNYLAYVSAPDLNGEKDVRVGMTGVAKIYSNKRTVYQKYLQRPLKGVMSWLKINLRPSP